MEQQTNKKKNKVASFFFGNRPVYFNVVFYVGLIISLGKYSIPEALGVGGAAIIFGWLFGKFFSWLIIKIASWFQGKDKNILFAKSVSNNWYMIFTIVVGLLYLITFFPVG